MGLEESAFLTSDSITKPVCYWHKRRNVNQWNKIERAQTDLRTYGYLFFDKGGKNTQERKDSLFNKWCWENWTATYKRMKLEYFLIPSVDGILQARILDCHFLLQGLSLT